MEKQTDKELEDEIKKIEDSVSYPIELDNDMHYYKLKGRLLGRQEARQGMVKIEDVERCICELERLDNEEILLEAKQEEEYLKKTCKENCYCKKINRDFPIIERVCDYCFIAGNHNIILGEYVYKIRIITDELKQSLKKIRRK